MGNAIAPLDDPAYVPVHQPVDGAIPDVVARWGARSQLRWFRRFHGKLAAWQDWERFYCESEHHRGLCCSSCFDEWGDGYGVMVDGWCCCRAVKEGS